MLKTSRGLILTINWLFPIKLVPVRTKGTLGESICAKVVIVKFLSAELTIGNFLFVTKEKVSSPRAPADNFSNPDKKEEFQIERPEKFGGNLNLKNYEELEKQFVEGKIHPLDLKNSVAEYLEKIIMPIREGWRA